MTPRFLLACAAAAVLLPAGAFFSGCSIAQTVRGQFSEFHEVATVPGEEKVVYAAVQESLEAMGYAWERGSLASHRLEMATRVQPGSSAQNLRQRRVILEFRAMGSQGTDVKVGFWEVSEEAGQRQTAVAGGRLIRGGPLYEAFWERVGNTLPPESEDTASGPAIRPAPAP